MTTTERHKRPQPAVEKTPELRNREELRHTDLLDYETAAPMLHCSARMVRKLVETRQLESVKVGRLVRVEPNAIAQFIERRRREASAS